MAITSANTSPIAAVNPSSTNKSAMAMVTTLFFMWGFLTSLNDILVPHLKSIFDLGYAQSQLVQLSFFSSYFVFGIPSGKIVEWIGYKKTMVVGLLTMSVGALLFIPAATLPSFPLFLTALIVLAAGITALQVSANPYVSVLGPAPTASSRLNFTQAFNSLGTTIAPLLGGWLILSSAPMAIDEVRLLSGSALQAYRIHEASSVKLPYLGIALALVLLALTIAMTRLPVITATQDFRPGSGDALSTKQLLRHRNLVLGAVGIFVYVGAEVSIGSFLINYFNLPEIGNMIARDAAKYVAFYWGGAMIGRFIGSAVLQKLPAGKTLGAVALIACALVGTSALTVGHFAMWSIILVGLFNSIMFPSIFTLGIAGLGPLTGKGSGIMIAAIVGGAIIPYVQGQMVDHGITTLHHAFILPFLCYLFIAYYGFEGSKQRVVA